MSGTGRNGLAAPAPRANAELLGHEGAERTLLRAFESGRLPHGWLIVGRRGIGKATLAYRFARFLLSRGAPPAGPAADLFAAPKPPAQTPAPAREDHVFRGVASGGHVDLRTLERRAKESGGEARKEIVVEDVRAAEAFLRMTATGGGWRVLVVDAADDLNRSAANALLKILEEPPRRAALLLVSHTPGILLPTLRSRCCRLALAPLPQATVEDMLARYAPHVAEGDARTLACLAEGSIGRALDLSASGGLDLYRELVALLGDLPQLDVARLHDLAERLGGAGADPAAFRTGMELLGWWLTRLVRCGARGEVPAGIVPGEAALMQRLLARVGLARLLGLWENVTRLGAQAEGANLDRKQVVVTALLEFEAAAA